MFSSPVGPAPLNPANAASSLCVLRPATPAEIGALVRLEGRFPLADRFSARAWRRLLAGNSLALVVIKGAELAGAGVVLYRRGTTVARLYSLVVHPAHEGAGIGRALLDALEAASARRGCTRMRLEVRMDNGRAKEFYERRGFRVVAPLPGYYDDGADGWRMEKILS